MIGFDSGLFGQLLAPIGFDRIFLVGNRRWRLMFAGLPLLS